MAVLGIWDTKTLLAGDTQIEGLRRGKITSFSSLSLFLSHIPKSP
jgi:hypothetical protein